MAREARKLDERGLKGRKIVPLTPKEMKKVLKDSPKFKQTKLKLKKGFVAAPLFYYVPTYIQLSDVDKKLVLQGLVKATTPQNAKDLCTLSKTWMYRSITPYGDVDCGVLYYKGLAVALFYKRQVTTIEPEPFDPVPFGALESDEDLYARLDLFCQSPKQLLGEARKELLEKASRILELEQQAYAYESFLAQKDLELKALRTQLNGKKIPSNKNAKGERK